MARYYYEIHMIANTDGDTFNELITNQISEWQNEGYYVEVQFSANNNQATALLLKYKEKKSKMF